MNFDRSRLYEDAESFFSLKGSISMYLNAAAAKEVCLLAASHRLLVARIEGGIWHSPGFEARIDCIWDGMNPPVNQLTLVENNKMAALFIDDESGSHDVFVITAPSMDGWTHVE